MAVLSIHEVDFITDSGSSYRCLDYGDEMLDAMEIGADQQGSTYSAIGAKWASASADGGGRRSFAWSRMKSHASHAAAASYAMSYPALFPFGESGKLRVSIQDGPVFDHFDALILAVPTMLKMDTAGFDTDTLFRGSAGRCVPVSGLPLTPGLPFSWILPTWGSITTAWGSL